MIQPINSVINKFSQKTEFTFEICDSIHLLTISKGKSLKIEVAVSPEYPEWEVFVFNRNNDKILVSELFDYIPVTNLNKDEVKVELQKAANDLNSFLERVSTTDVRVQERNTFFVKHLVFESLDNGEWIFEFNNALVKWNNPDRGQKIIYT